MPWSKLSLTLGSILLPKLHVVTSPHNLGAKVATWAAQDLCANFLCSVAQQPSMVQLPFASYMLTCPWMGPLARPKVMPNYLSWGRWLCHSPHFLDGRIVDNVLMHSYTSLVPPL